MHLHDEVQPGHEYRIYGDDNCVSWAVVDDVDYCFFQRWKWCLLNWRGKTYMRRAVGENANGQRIRTYSLYLHVEIMKRAGVEPPTELHNIVDHKNGDSLDCRRRNLRWATKAQNNRNRFGREFYQLALS